jgi:hypothetical protein
MEASKPPLLDNTTTYGREKEVNRNLLLHAPPYITIAFLTDDLQTDSLFFFFFDDCDLFSFWTDDMDADLWLQFWPVIVGKSTVEEAVRAIDINRQGYSQEPSSAPVFYLLLVDNISGS